MPNALEENRDDAEGHVLLGLIRVAGMKTGRKSSNAASTERRRPRSANVRIAIVNDSKLGVEALRRILFYVPEHELAWEAGDGAEAVEKCGNDTPDLILMDLIMPVMDGGEATRQIMEANPCAILIVTASVGGNAGKVFQAMGNGALDAIDTPVGSPRAVREVTACSPKSRLLGSYWEVGCPGAEKRRSANGRKLRCRRWW